MPARAAVVLLSLPWSLLPGPAAAQAPPFPGIVERATGMLGAVPVAVTRGVLADLDADGDADLVGTSFQGHAVVVVLAAGGTLRTPGIAHATAQNPVHLVLADVDVDGDPDIVAVAYGTPAGGPELRVLFNDGSGGFAAVQPSVQAMSAHFSFLRVARFDNDGIPDLLLQDGGGQLVFRRGLGNGSFGPEVQAPPRLSPTTLIAMADDDGDGDDDLHYLVGTATSADLVTHRNDGTGTFAAPVVSAGQLPAVWHTAFADVDGDGRLDAVLSGTPVSGVTEVQVLHGNGAGGFTAGPLQRLGALTFGFGPTLVDVDGDGDRDYLAVEANGSSREGVLLALNDGAGRFPASQVIDYTDTFVTSTAWVGAGDVDRDGRPEVVCGFDGLFVQHRGLGPAGVEAPRLADLGGLTVRLQLADLQQDGLPEALSLRESGELLATRNLAGAPLRTAVAAGAPVRHFALADFDRDGRLDLVVARDGGDLALLRGDGTGGFGAPAVFDTGGPVVALRAADADGDGRQDVLALRAQLEVRLGDGAGGFTPPIPTAVCNGCTGNRDLLLADLDRDGVLDALVFHPLQIFQPATAEFWRGNGNGTFLLVAAQTTSGLAQERAVLADIDGDGALDLLQLSGGIYLHERRGNGQGGFGALASRPVLPPTNQTRPGDHLAAGDFDGDGDLDVVLAGGGLLRNDAGNLTQLHQVALPRSSGPIAVADVDGDLQQDLVFQFDWLGRLCVVPNQTPGSGTAVGFGIGCPGSGGFVPHLAARGLPQPGGTVTIELAGALGAAPTFLLASAAPANLPFGAGCRVFVALQGLITVPWSVSGPAVAGAGRGSMTIAIPALLPGGATLAIEGVVLDPGAALGIAGSNGMFWWVR